MTLRPYQQRIVNSTTAAWEWSDRVLVVAPTGSGKTVIAASIIERHLWHVPRRPVLFLCERLTLVDQARTALATALPNVRIGVMQAERYEPGDVIVASQQTIESRGWPLGIGLVVIDEAHIQRAEIMDGLPDVPVLGLTATPLAAGMAQHWQVMVSQVTTRELIDASHLVDVEVLTHDEADLAAPVRHWTEHAGNRPTIGFTESCESAFGLAGMLPGAWEVCWHGDSATERRTKVDSFRAGRLQGLLSVDALGRGLDVPGIGCLLACRPLHSLSTWLQQLGRVMRPAAGKGQGTGAGLRRQLVTARRAGARLLAAGTAAAARAAAGQHGGWRRHRPRPGRCATRRRCRLGDGHGPATRSGRAGPAALVRGQHHRWRRGDDLPAVAGTGTERPES